MKFQYQFLIALFVVSLAGGLIWSANHYHSEYLDQKQRADAAETVAKQRQDTINDMQTRQRDVAALDEKYTKELVDAQKNISALRGDVESGRKQLRIAATCSNVRQATGTASMDDATAPGLTDAAQRDYFTLRERIETVTSQLTGLQAYVREQCLK